MDIMDIIDIMDIMIITAWLAKTGAISALVSYYAYQRELFLLSVMLNREQGSQTISDQCVE